MSKSCPLGHTCDKCHWLVRLRGVNPNTGQEVDNDMCAIAALPMLLIENSQQQRGTAAAVESFRNEMVEGNNMHLRILAERLMPHGLLEK
jgi:hypothetical protein